MKQKKQQEALTLKMLNKSNIWDMQENDIFRLWEAAEKEADLKENVRRYFDIIKTAFDIEEVKVDKKEVIAKIEGRGFKVGKLRIDEETKQKWAIKKRPILRVTDLTYENIRHISAAKLIEVLDRNFGGGWDSLSQSIKDIIESGFEISTTTVPKDRLKAPGGLYEKKLNDGFEVLEIAKGTYVEAIFAKVKPIVEKPHASFADEEREDREDDEIDVDNENDFDDDDDDTSYDDDMLTEESYRTTYETDPDDLNIEAEDVSDEDY